MPNYAQNNPLRSVADYQDQYARADANALAVQQGRLKVGEYQRGLQEQQQVRNLLSQTKTPEEAVNVLRSGGFVTQADAIEKGMVARKAQEAVSAKTGAEVTEKHYSLVKQLAGLIQQDPRQQTAGAVLDLWEKVTGMSAGPYRQSFANAGDNSDAIKQIAAGIAVDADKLLPKTERIDTGGAVQLSSVDAITGKPTTTGTFAKTPTPGEVLSSETQLRGQNMTDARVRERLAFDQGTQVAESGGPEQAALVKRFGKPAPDHRWKLDGSQEVIPGTPSDTKAQSASALKDTRAATLTAQADTVLGTIKDAKALVGWNTAGFGGIAKVVPMTDARKLSGHVETIKANIGFDRLQQMREMSPTGGALGQVAVQELNFLQSTVAKLDQLQSPTDVVEALDKIERHYKRWRETMGGSTGGSSGEWGDGWSIKPKKP
jgi:hypothetical protein